MLNAHRDETSKKEKRKKIKNSDATLCQQQIWWISAIRLVLEYFWQVYCIICLVLFDKKNGNQNHCWAFVIVFCTRLCLMVEACHWKLEGCSMNISSKGADRVREREITHTHHASSKTSTRYFLISSTYFQAKLCMQVYA